MFSIETYIERRKRLPDQLDSGLILLLGNQDSPMNYPDNTFEFRQDSSFLYFFGLDFPSLVGVIDIDEGKEIIFGDDLTMDDIIWTGLQPSIAEKAAKTGITQTAPMDNLNAIVKSALDNERKVHFLPQYRAENLLTIENLTGIPSAKVNELVSVELIKAVVAQRSFKSDEEIAQIEKAVDICYDMHTAAMKNARPGMYERQIAGLIEGIAISAGGRVSFATIFSIHGETLQKHYHGKKMKSGYFVINDSGAESAMHYAGDITRTIPIGGKFDSKQTDIYNIVYDAQQKAIAAVKPGVEFRNIHLLAGEVLADGLKQLGLMKGDIKQAVQQGAHALFFQCGLGHMMGLDVHDMEGLGEQYVGYTDTIKRNPLFGIRSLRLGRALEERFVITVEPGLYFIPELIDRWKAENKFTDFIDYEKVQTYKDFGGVRLEDDVLVTAEGCRVLGKPIPNKIEEVEVLASS